ncbi:MAG: putative gamma-glutamyltranspeptidase [Ilumatobacteraceae bacterium]|nr:putative gamma-glutamyltranspeptidase [Ilumatobacteraceae bacterium]
MAGNAAPFTSTTAPGAMVASADQLATQAGMAVLAKGGNAVDAAIATNAAIAVTGPHLCGMGGDLYALVHDGHQVHALNSTGRAGAGSDAAQLRAEGRTEMPYRHDIRTVTMPGCVDGWAALHERFARLPMADLLAPAIRLAEEGFPASPLLVGSLALLDDPAREALHELVSQARRPGALVRRPGAGRALRAIAEGGRDGFYLGEFGTGLRRLGNGHFSEADLQRSNAEWVDVLSQPAFNKVLHTMPPNSQGYLTLGAAALIDQLGPPDDPDDAQWAHLLIEAATVAGHDRPAVLHEGADGAALLRRIVGDIDRVDASSASRVRVPTFDGDTTYLCAVDADRLGVSLIQSNASGFGSWLVEPNTQINLHNRGLGFSVAEGHPAELAPGRRPPHTLSPALATNRDGSLAAVFGTMGGDGQPQILLQVATRLFHHGASPAEAIHAGRWLLHGPVTGFDTWTGEGGPHVIVEGHSSPDWLDGLEQRGHEVRVMAPYDSAFGHAHVILVEDSGMLAGAADPRTRVGSVAGL